MEPVNPLHILVIEDDADTRANLRDILEMDNHRVESAGSAAEALRREDWSPISAIILDRRLPDATADELLPKLRQAAPDAAVIIVTGYADLQGAISALRQGATDYILKPIQPDELRSRLRRSAEYRGAQEALRLAERHFRLLVQNSSDIITAFDAEGTILYQNPTIERMLGHRPEDRIGRNIFRDSIVHPDDMAVKRAFVDEIRRRRGSSVMAEFRLRHVDGSWRSVEAVGQDMLDEPGVGAIVASYRDVTERKRAEEALRASEERFRRLFEAGIVGVGITDDRGNWLEVNDELLRILGRSRDALMDKEVRSVEMPLAKYLSLDERGLAEARRRGVCAPYEKECVRKDGTTVPVLIGCASLGTLGTRFICVVLDITATKKAEDLLRRERDLAHGLIDAAPAVVLMLDTEGRIVRFNRYAEDLSGYRADEVLGRHVSILLPERDRARINEVFRIAPDPVDTMDTVNPILTKDGREREVRWSNRVLRDAKTGIDSILAVGQDVTDLKEAQERALLAERLAAIGQMVAGLAHESRNALQRSQACMEMLALHVEDRPEALGLIARLQRAQDHLHHLYEDVRGYAAPIRLERCDHDLAAVWREAWAHLEPQWTVRRATLREVTGGLDLWCKVDRFRLERVFGNVLENALAASPDPVVLEVICTPAEIDGRAAVRVAIRDNGPGIGPEDRQRIFEPFYTTKTKGTGLGMAISRRIVEAHGGRIAVGDGTGQGAEITITLPRGEP